MKMLFVCLKTVMGRESVGFVLPLLGHKVIGCKVRKYSGLAAFLTCHSHIILALSSEYYDK